MKAFFFVFLFQLFVFLSTAQKVIDFSNHDTVYFNKHWKRSHRENATYYRIIKDTNDRYIVSDYYRDGHMQMNCNCSSHDLLTKDATCSYYYKNGQIKASGTYSNSEAIGVWRYWNKKGVESKSIEFGKPEAELFDSASCEPQNQSSIFLVNLSYRDKVNNSILNSGHGFGMEIGVNFGYFISQKWLLGIFGGLGTRDILYGTRFSSKFMKDFNAAANVTQFHGNDSLVAVSTLRYMNSGQGYFHDRTVYAGLMIKLPYKYAPIVKLYKGYSSFECKTSDRLILKPYDEKDRGPDHDYYEFYRTMDWGVEIFLYNGLSRVRDYKPEGIAHSLKKNGRWNRNLFGFSFYIESYDWRSATLSFSGNQYVEIPLRQLVGADFLHKYKKEYIVGFRLSIGIF